MKLVGLGGPQGGGTRHGLLPLGRLLTVAHHMAQVYLVLSLFPYFVYDAVGKLPLDKPAVPKRPEPCWCFVCTTSVVLYKILRGFMSVQVQDVLQPPRRASSVVLITIVTDVCSASCSGIVQTCQIEIVLSLGMSFYKACHSI